MTVPQHRFGLRRRRLQEDANSTARRRCQLLTLLPQTVDPVPPSTQRIPVDFRIHIEASAWLAWYHYTTLISNFKNDTTAATAIVLPELRERWLACDVDFDVSMRDSRFSALNAAKELLDAYLQPKMTYPEGSFLDQLQEILGESQPIVDLPDALIGSASSTVSSSINFIASAYDIPQISSSSTASYLDQKDVYPLFSRTVPTNRGDAQAMAVYFSEYLNASHVGVLFINDVYGNSFHSDLVMELKQRSIIVHSEPYDDDNTIETTIQRLADSKFHYIVALLNPRTWQSILRTALQFEIIGRPDYFWMFGESSLTFVDPSFQLRRDTEADLALALHGSAVLSATETPYAPLDQALLEFSQSEALQQFFIESHVDPDIFLNYTFVPPGRSLYQYLTYDAVVAMMLAVCEVPRVDGNKTTGRAIYAQLLQTEFVGVSGHVSFDPITGTRKSEDILYGVRNVRFPNATPEAYLVDPTLTALINLTGEASLEFVAPFYYASNSSTPPPPLAPVQVDMNLIPTGMRAFCLSLSALVMCVSVGFGTWTYYHRDKDVVKASQPIFLVQICVGTFIIASSVIPTSLQEPLSNRGLDIACMSAPWLVSIGFVTAFSALFSKTWRLNKLFLYSRNLRRIVVKPRDVALPFVILMTINIGVLLAWTLDAPLVWERDYDSESTDAFGRSMASIGHCEPSDPRSSTVYLSLIVVINISVLLFANYQAYLARNLPTEFSESTYITVAMGLLLEVCILGIPLLFLASGDPTVSLLIRTILATASGLAILLPIFLPKYIQRNVNRRYDKAVLERTGVAPTKSKIVISMWNGNNSSPENPGLDPLAEENLGVIGATKIRRNDEYFKERRISLNAKAGNMRRSSANSDRRRSTLTSDRTSSSWNPSLPSSNPRSSQSESS
jgi:7 transmembrane sweet-taste receptor of 3 GCPR/Receptor family ligand binding region